MDPKIQDSTGTTNTVQACADRVAEKRELRSTEKDPKIREPSDGDSRQKEKPRRYSTSKSKSKEDAILEQLSFISSKLANNDATLQELANRVSSFEDCPQDSYNGDDGSHIDTPDDFLGEDEPDQDVHDITRESFAAFLQKDKDVSIIENEGPSGKNDTDSPSILDIMRRNKPPSAFGPPLEESIAKLFLDIVDQQQDKKLLEGLKESYKLPDNCKLMGSPRVNPELWSIMDKSSITQDLDSRSTQDIFSLNMVILAKAVQLVNENNSSLGGKFANDLMNLISDATAASAYAFRDFNSRRAAIKRSLPRDVSAGCTAEMKTTDLLFGDKFAENLKAARAAMSLTKTNATQGRNKPRFHPYGDKGYQQRPKGPANQQYQGAHLNSNRPPPRGRASRVAAERERFQIHKTTTTTTASPAEGIPFRELPTQQSEPQGRKFSLSESQALDSLVKDYEQLGAIRVCRGTKSVHFHRFLNSQV